MNSKTKPETESQLRVPKAKNKLGLRVPQISMPHEDLIYPEKPRLEIVPKSETPPRQSSQPSNTRQSSQPTQSRQSKEISPSKNYHKVTNTITRQAIPEGLFVGKSKQLYDVLYALTRGAITPKRKIRISKTKLMKQSSIGSRITFDACVDRLGAVGLLKMQIYPGEHEGNEFEILLPEEIKGVPSQGSQSNQSSQTSPAQKPVRVDIPETSQTNQSLSGDDTGSYENSKTFFKTSLKPSDDDFALKDFAQVFENLSRKFTGKNLSLSDREKWRELAELLGTEFEIAAARTKSVSSVPAFLTAHLRRRLFARSAAPSSNISRSLEVGKPFEEIITTESSPLAEHERESVLESLRQTKDWYFFEDQFTAEDWAWLKPQLETNNESGQA